MNLTDIKTKSFTLIKVLSTILITSAIGLELSNIYALLIHSHLPSFLNPIFGLGRFAMAVHFVEGVIAASSATSRNKMPIRYGAYTFFVGTVALLELFEIRMSRVE